MVAIKKHGGSVVEDTNGKQQYMIEKMEDKWGKLPVELVEITNNFFGDSITVAGLLCGCDIIEQLRGKELGEKLMITDEMLREETDIFLDDLHVSDIEKQLGIRVQPVRRGGADLFYAVLDI